MPGKDLFQSNTIGGILVMLLPYILPTILGYFNIELSVSWEQFVDLLLQLGGAAWAVFGVIRRKSQIVSVMGVPIGK